MKIKFFEIFIDKQQGVVTYQNGFEEMVYKKSHQAETEGMCAPCLFSKSVTWSENRCGLKEIVDTKDGIITSNQLNFCEIFSYWVRDE